MYRLTMLAVLLAAFGGGAAFGQTPPAAQPSSPPTAQMPPPRVGEEMRVAADDIDKLLAEGKVVFLDVREPKELEELGTREGYINIPLGELEKRLDELPKDKAILTA